MDFYTEGPRDRRESVEVIDEEVSPKILKWPAHLVSILLHPLFVPLYVMYFLVYLHPYLFAGFTPVGRVKTMAMVFVNLSFFPALTVFLLWRLKFIDSVLIRTSRERIIPISACIIFYFWGYYVFRNQPAIPKEVVLFLFGSFLGVSLSMILNSFFKVSLHMLSLGVVVTFFTILGFKEVSFIVLPMLIAILAAGLAATSRLILSAHRPFDIYAGFIGGMIAQVIAMMIQ